MEIRATLTYDTAPTDDQTDDLLTLLIGAMPDNGVVLSSNGSTLDVTFALDDTGPLVDLRPFAAMVKNAMYMLDLGELEPIAAAAVEASVIDAQDCVPA